MNLVFMAPMHHPERAFSPDKQPKFLVHCNRPSEYEKTRIRTKTTAHTAWHQARHMGRAGTPTMVAPGCTLATTTAPMPTKAPAPTVRFWRIAARAPI